MKEPSFSEEPVFLSDAEARALEWLGMAAPHAIDRRFAPRPWLDAAQQRLLDARLISERETGPGDAVLVLEVTDAGRRWLENRSRA
jgi:hypothetical protein